MQEQLIKPNVKALSGAIKQAVTGGCGSTMLGHLFVIVQVEEIIAGHLQQDVMQGSMCKAAMHQIQRLDQGCWIEAAGSRLLDQGCWIKAAGSRLLYKAKGHLLHSQNLQKSQPVSSLACCIWFVGQVQMSEYTKLTFSICL